MSQPIGSVYEEIKEPRIDPLDPPVPGQAGGLAACILLGMALMGASVAWIFLWGLSH